MKSKKKLFEAKATDPEVHTFMEMCKHTYSPFMEKWYVNFAKHLKEADQDSDAGEPEVGAFRGQSVQDTLNAGTDSQVCATLEVFNTVIRGFHRYMDDSFVKKYTTESTDFKIPLTEYVESAGNMSAGEMTHTEKELEYAEVNLAAGYEKGAKISWTRSLLEDMTFDIQAELLEGMGHAIAKMIMEDILKKLFGYDLGSTEQNTYEGTTAGGSLLTISNPITWANFLAVVQAVDIGTLVTTDTDWETRKSYGPADYVLCSPDVYWQLLQIIQLTNVLYEGSTEPINSGRIKLALGCTILKESLMPYGTIAAVNSEKAIALVTRRSLRIEPIIFPVWNEYGFIGSVRYGVTVIYPQAIALGATSGNPESEVQG